MVSATLTGAVHTLAATPDAALGWQAWLTGALILLMLVVLASGRYSTDVVMLGVLVILLAAGILEPGEAVRGFSNTGVITVALLYVIATGLQETGAMTILTVRLLGRPTTALQAQARMVVPVAVMSAFVNNTPIVAMFMPVLRELSKRTGIAASRLFMPLSFAAIIGGICTLIGTSTNLVTQGLLIDHNRSHPEDPLPIFGMWTLAWVGVPIAAVGIGYMLAFGRRLLPDRGGKGPSLETARQYMTAMRVMPGSPIVGKTIEQAGLRHLPGLFLSRLERASETVVAVAPEEVLRAGDTLFFVGVLDSVVDLQKINGLEPVADEKGTDKYRPKMRLVEAVISSRSPLIGRSIREGGFRTRYGAVVVAVQRQGERLARKIGDIVLRPGDTLLLEAPRAFVHQFRHSTDFYLISELEGAAAPRHERAYVAIGVLVLMVLAMTFNWVDHMVAAMLGAGMMVGLRCCTASQARAGVEWPVLIVIGTAFGIGKAMEKTHLAAAIADHGIGWASTLGPWAMLAVVYFITLVFTALISHAAAVAIMFPIALAVAHAHHLNFMPFVVCITIAASCEFDTPLGYQTHLMVMGPGGYRWLDFTRYGLPLTLLCAVVCIVLAPLVFGFGTG